MNIDEEASIKYATDMSSESSECCDQRSLTLQRETHTALVDGNGDPRFAKRVSYLLRMTAPVYWNTLDLGFLRKKCVGLWVEELRGAVVLHQRGGAAHRSVNFFRLVDEKKRMALCFYPEETLFLMERGSLILVHAQTTTLISIQEMYELLFYQHFFTTRATPHIEPPVSLAAYLSYSYLRRRGVALTRQCEERHAGNDRSAAVPWNWHTLADPFLRYLKATPSQPRPLLSPQTYDAPVLEQRQVDHTKTLFQPYFLGIPAKSLRSWTIRLKTHLRSENAQNSSFTNRLPPAPVGPYARLMVVDPEADVFSFFNEHLRDNTMTSCSFILFSLSFGSCSPTFLCGSPLQL